MSDYQDDRWMQDLERRRQDELEEEEARHWRRIERLYEKGELPLKTKPTQQEDE